LWPRRAIAPGVATAPIIAAPWWCAPTVSATSLDDLRGGRCAVNDLGSNSGMNLLRAEIAPLANGKAFFKSVLVTGSHLAGQRRGCRPGRGRRGGARLRHLGSSPALATPASPRA
jgi:hypothetical protein